MKPEEIREKFDSALKKFFDGEIYLLKKDVSERAVTHKLAIYIEQEFQIANIEVDCEYNRNLDDPKNLVVIRNDVTTEREKIIRENNANSISEDETQVVNTYPDIIVHERGNSHRNILIVEVKKQGRYLNSNTKRIDIEKLKGFTGYLGNEYNYKLGIYICFNVGEKYKCRDCRI